MRDLDNANHTLRIIDTDCIVSEELSYLRVCNELQSIIFYVLEFASCSMVKYAFLIKSCGKILAF